MRMTKNASNKTNTLRHSAFIRPICRFLVILVWFKQLTQADSFRQNAKVLVMTVLRTSSYPTLQGIDEASLGNDIVLISPSF